MMAYIVYDPSLYATVTAKINLAVAPKLSGLEIRLKQCPRLMALNSEVSQSTISSAYIRTVESDTPLGNVILRRRSKVLVIFGQLHSTEKTFRNDANQFNPKRFSKDKSCGRVRIFGPSEVNRHTVRANMLPRERCCFSLH